MRKTQHGRFSLAERLLERWVAPRVEARARLMLTDADGFYAGRQAHENRDRADYDREAVLSQAMEAWRLNPLARRLVSLTGQYVVGGGIRVSSPDPEVNHFLQEWWNHPLNNLPLQIFEWCEELSRAGELFLTLSTDAAGMTYVRAIPAAQIDEVLTRENDLHQETGYVEKDTSTGGGLQDGRRWKAYNPLEDAPGPDGAFEAAMLHYAVNRPPGALRGESDLAPLLKWLGRYSSWLEDRVRLNRYRQIFLFMVTARFASEAERLARQTALNANPPGPGSILVTDESETWSVIRPELDSYEAREDGLAIKKMIASGAGVPLHFLAEPEGTNRTTAESAGGPTFRHYEQRQEFFTLLVKDVARAAVRRQAVFDRRLNPLSPVEVSGTDLSARDNIALAQASGQVILAYIQLYEKGLIGKRELVRLAYRFVGETVDPQAVLDDPKGGDPE